jgi:hypothetical protein
VKGRRKKKLGFFVVDAFPNSLRVMVEKHYQRAILETFDP